MTKDNLIVPPQDGALPVGCLWRLRNGDGNVCPHSQGRAFGVMAADVD